jgi:hypothetical protein
MEDVTRPCEEMFRSVSGEDWRPLYQHAKKLEKAYNERDAHFDNAVELIIVSSRGVQSDDNESSEEDNSADPRDDEKYVAWHCLQGAVGERGKQSVFSVILYMLRQILCRFCRPPPPCPIHLPSSLRLFPRRSSGLEIFCVMCTS